jgi:hypothetical protein
MNAAEKATPAAPEAKDRLVNPRSAYDWSRISSELDDMGLSVQAFRVYCNLLRRSDKHSHSCYPGVRRIAEDCRLNKDTVGHAISELEKAGMLKTHKSHGMRTDYEILPLSEWKMPPGTVRNKGTVETRNGQTVRNGGTPVSETKVHPVSETRGPNPIHYNPIQETTTTTRARAHTKAARPVAEAPSSFSSVVGGVSEEPSGELTLEDRLDLDRIALEFGSDSRQKAKAEATAKRRGMAFVREQADIVRNDPKIRNLAGAFERACDSPDGWKRPKAAPKKPARKKAPEPQPEAPSEPQADFWAELAWWQSATDAQREDILRDPRFDLHRHRMRKGVTAASLGLPVLREVLAELAQQAAGAATAFERAQQPAEKAA